MANKKNKDNLSKKVATLAVLNNASLSTAEKVDRLLEIKQWDKEFKDTGGRLPGSTRKEGAAIKTIYKHEDQVYMEALSREFDKYKLDDETKRKMMENSRKTYSYEVGVQRLINKGDELRNKGKLEAVGQYLAALRLIMEYREKHKADAERVDTDGLWHKKSFFTVFNGMGIAYSKRGKITDAVENFQDAIKNAPNEKSREMAKSNLEKLKVAYEKKTGTRMHTFEQYPL